MLTYKAYKLLDLTIITIITWIVSWRKLFKSIVVSIIHSNKYKKY